MHYVVVDIETIGGNPKQTKITEIALYKTNGKEIIDEFVSLVNPETAIPDFIVRLTGISDKMVLAAPKFFEIAKKIIEFCQDCVFVAHNVSFDYTVLRHEFKSLGFEFRFPHLCTVRASKYMIPDLPSYSLGKLAKSLNIELNGRHRAGGDALATTHLFNLLHNKNFKGLEKFIQTELNPKHLHPNLDLDILDELPSKIGVYKFYDDTNRLIYIGKSKNIKKRVEQHLRNSNTKKGIELQQAIHRIDFELTGSELIALLLESSLIKKEKPRFNKALKKDLFPYGLYQYENELGYIQLYIEQNSKTSNLPIVTFSSKIEANKFLVEQVKRYTLCSKLCNIENSNLSCFNFQIKQCFGACVQKENSEKYNIRVLQLISKFSFPFENFFIIENGINRNEKSIILVQNGIYKGFGKIPFYALDRRKDYWKRYIDYSIEDKDAKSIISSFIRTSEHIKIVQF